MSTRAELVEIAEALERHRRVVRGLARRRDTLIAELVGEGATEREAAQLARVAPSAAHKAARSNGRAHRAS